MSRPAALPNADRALLSPARLCSAQSRWGASVTPALAVPPAGARRPEMAPQMLETIESAPGNRRASEGSTSSCPRVRASRVVGRKTEPRQLRVRPKTLDLRVRGDDSVDEDYGCVERQRCELGERNARKWRRKGLKQLNPRPEIAGPRKSGSPVFPVGPLGRLRLSRQRCSAMEMAPQALGKTESDDGNGAIRGRRTSRRDHGDRSDEVTGFGPLKLRRLLPLHRPSERAEGIDPGQCGERLPVASSQVHGVLA
jgi:hypothetical protein